jgi:hypothetical protein
MEANHRLIGLVRKTRKGMKKIIEISKKKKEEEEEEEERKRETERRIRTLK